MDRVGGAGATDASLGLAGGLLDESSGGPSGVSDGGAGNPSVDGARGAPDNGADAAWASTPNGPPANGVVGSGSHPNSPPTWIEGSRENRPLGLSIERGTAGEANCGADERTVPPAAKGLCNCAGGARSEAGHPDANAAPAMPGNGAAAARSPAPNGPPANGEVGSGSHPNSPPTRIEGSREKRPIALSIERGVAGDANCASGARIDCGKGQPAAVVKSGAEVEASGGFDCCGHGPAARVFGAGLDQSPGKIGGCQAIAPSCAAEKGAGAFANGPGALARKLMNGSVQSTG